MTGAPTATLRATDRTRGRQAGGRPRASGTRAPGGPGGPRRPLPPEVYRRRRLVVAGALIAVLVFGLFLVQKVRGGADDSTDGLTAPVETVPDAGTAADDAAPAAAAAAADPAATDEAAAADDAAASDAPVEELEDSACMLDEPEVTTGDSGEAVECAQRALRAAGFYDGEIDGEFDDDVISATRDFQHEYDLYIDGIVGKNTATELGIWPGQDAFIVRTPPPPEGATDSWGMLLSPVASTGDDAPPLPDGAGQGSGKRVVYERASQRVWAINGDEQIVRSYLVTGSQYRNEVPGVHTVYSKSEMALGWDLSAELPYMIRYTKTERGHIGFHAIPSWKDTGEKLQTVDELGQKLSGGCTRQHPLDAQFLWAFANVGTKVHVL